MHLGVWLCVRRYWAETRTSDIIRARVASAESCSMDEDGDESWMKTASKKELLEYGEHGWSTSAVLRSGGEATRVSRRSGSRVWVVLKYLSWWGSCVGGRRLWDAIASEVA